MRVCSISATVSARSLPRRVSVSLPIRVIADTILARLATVASSVPWMSAAFGEMVRPSSAVSV